MAANTRQETARRYLLGQMSQEEATEFESEFFADDDLFEEMSSLENDLIDSFVRGELSERERRQFETGYITCQARRENVEFARQLLTHIEEPQQAFSSAKLNVAQERSKRLHSFASYWLPRLAFAIALIAIGATSWLIISNRRLQREVDQVRFQQADLQRSLREEFQTTEQRLREQISSLEERLRETVSDSERQLATGNTKPRGLDIVALALTPGLERTASESKTVILPRSPVLVRLNLYLERDDYPSYRASIETPSGVTVWRKSHLRASGPTQGKMVTLEVASQVLFGDDFLIRLRGVTPTRGVHDVGDYRLFVRRR